MFSVRLPEELVQMVVSHRVLVQYHLSFDTGETPFEVIYGTMPREFGMNQIDECTVPDLAAWLKEREVMLELLQQQLKQAQDRMKKQADK